MCPFGATFPDRSAFKARLFFELKRWFLQDFEKTTFPEPVTLVRFLRPE